MPKSKYYIIIFLIIIIVFTGCSSNKALQNQKKADDKINTPPQSQNINNDAKPDENKKTDSKPEKTEKPDPKPENAEKSDPKPEKVEKPDPKPEKIEIGSFQTTLKDKDEDRIKNITIAVKKINGYVIQPGDVFSFNNVVGERKPSKGYKKARIIVNGEKDEDIGGGVCQLSSTIYNAAEKSGLEIIERHSHTKEVGYVPMGKDAAVDYGNLDLKFKNTRNYPVKIESSIENGKVYVKFFKV